MNILKKRIENKKATIVVLGLGYIGFPTALIFAKGGFKVIGVDKNKNVIEKISKNTIYSYEPSIKELWESAKNNFEIGTEIKKGDVYIICVQTPLTTDKKVDLSYLHNAIGDVGKVLEKTNLVIIESTIPVGETLNCADALSKFSGISSDDFFVSHCPERVLPTNIVEELIKNNRIVGGINKKSAELAKLLYSKIVEGEIVETGSNISELSKLTENVFRDVNIALANELSMICDELNIDVFEVIRIANMHPRVKIHSPGTGVGGHCVPLDTYFITNSIRDSNLCELMLTSRKINDYKPKFVAKKIIDKLDSKKSVGIFGVTYKPNIDDTRESPAKTVIETLLKNNCEVFVYDPYTLETFGGKNATIEEVLNKDVIAILTPHKEFKKIKKQLVGKKLVNPYNF